LYTYVSGQGKLGHQNGFDTVQYNYTLVRVRELDASTTVLVLYSKTSE
jgi:hypothetical protein